MIKKHTRCVSFVLTLLGMLAIPMLSSLFLTGCASDAPAASAEINIGCMKGPTAIGMIKLLSDSNEGTTQNTYLYTIAGTADELSAALIQGDMDIAAVPCNLASVLYNRTEGEIVTVAIK